VASSSSSGAEARALPPPPVPEIVVDAPAQEALPRAALGAIVQQGMGRLLQRVQVEPARNGNRFIGHRVIAMDPVWADGPVHVGDVVVRLNGTTLESPDKAQQALATLRVASELVVDVIRDGKPVRTHLAID